MVNPKITAKLVPGKKPGEKGSIDLTISCAICDKPLTVRNDLGSFCEDMHGIEEARQAQDFLDNFLKTLPDR